MPRLLQINSTANWGSTGKIAEQIGQRAMAHGWESYIAYGRRANPSTSTLIKIGSRLGQAWHLVVSRLFDRHGLASTLATKRLIREIERIKPDVIHLHNIHGYYLNYKVLFSYLNSVDTPVVWTLHDCWSFTGHCSHYFSAKCMKWQHRCEHCSFNHTYPKAFSDSSYRNFELKRRLFTSLGERLTLVPVSQWLADQTRKSFMASQRIRYIYNGINTSVYRPHANNSIRRQYDIDKRILIVGVASTWSKSKGWDDYITLRKMLPEQYVIMMVGTNKAQSNNLPRGIIAVPRTSSEGELANIYNTADIVISLSQQETFGLTIAEGMSAGTPSIAYNTTALPELITPDTGFVVDQGDIDGIVSAIKEIERNGKAHYSEACRKRAEEHFDKDKCFDRYIELYNEILTNKR